MNQDDRHMGKPGGDGDVNRPSQDSTWVGDQGLELHRLIARRRPSRRPKQSGKGEGGTHEPNHDKR